jgi:hypothetical protein
MPRFLSLVISALLALSLSGPGDAQALTERRVALIVGNSNYKDSGLHLENPKNDASDIAAVLKQLDFEVVLVTDVGKRDIDMALQRFARLATNADSALFYYAGHALQFEGKNYIMPIDAELEDDISIKFNMVPIDDVREALDRANQSGVKIMVLDACRNNPIADRLLRMNVGTTRSANPTRGLARIDKTQGMIVAYATAANDVAYDGNNARNSPFTSALIKYLQEPGLEIEMMFRRVTADVSAQTNGRQRPETYISLLSEYYINQSDRHIWETLRDNGSLEQVRDFVQRFPYSVYAFDAKHRLDLLEQSARERAEQAQLQRERERTEQETARRRELEERLAKLEAAQQEVNRQAAEQEAQRRRVEQDRLARLEAERQAAEQQAAKRREEQDRLTRLEAERQAAQREQEAKRQQDERDRLARLEAERQGAAREAAEAAEVSKRKEAADRLAKLEEERIKSQKAAAEAEAGRKRAAEEQQAKLEADRLKALSDAAAQAAAQRREEENKKKAELNCQRERAALGPLANDAAKLDAFAGTATCEEVRIVAEGMAATKRAEQARLEQTCQNEQAQLDVLRGAGPAARGQLLKLQQGLNCDRLRPFVMAALSEFPDTSSQPSTSRVASQQLIRNMQVELHRLGCFNSEQTGVLNDETRAGIKRFFAARGRTGDSATASEDLLLDLKQQGKRVCPLSCQSGESAKGDHCIANRPTKDKTVAKRPVERHAPPPAAATVNADVRPAPARPGAQIMHGIGF